MVKNLLNKIKKSARRTILGITASIFLAGCPNQCNPVDPTPSYTPTGTISASENPTEVGKKTYLTTNWEERNGTDDLFEYKLGIDKDGNEELDENEKLIEGLSSITNYPWTPDSAGTFKILAECTNQKGKVGKTSLDILVKESEIPIDPVIPDTDYVDISGRLQDNETDTDRAGFIVVKNSTDNFIIGTYVVNGAFSFTLPKLISELPDGIILEARLGTQENPTSYKRTIELPAGDHNPITDPRGNPAIRPVIYDNPDDTYDDGLLDTEEKRNNFIEHAGRVNFSDQVSINPLPQSGSEYLKKWNLGELENTNAHPILQGIKIAKLIPDYENVTTSIKEEYPNILIQEEDNLTEELETGWIKVFPSESGEGPYTKIYDSTQDGYIEKAKVYLNTSSIDVVIHEIFHGSLFPGHADSSTTEKLFDSIMVYTGSKFPTKAADKKMRYLIEEPTHLGMEKLENILGKN